MLATETLPAGSERRRFEDRGPPTEGYAVLGDGSQEGRVIVRDELRAKLSEREQAPARA
jgi:hypothetical protein